MSHYEVTFIVDPVLSGDEIKSAAKSYEDMLKTEGFEIVNIDELGLQQLAYPINKRTTGIYYCIEFKGDVGNVIPKVELSLNRDERIMRFLTIKLDKFGVKYNDDKRQGKIGKVKKKEVKKDDRHDRRSGRSKPAASKNGQTKEAPAKEAAAPAKEAAPANDAPAKEVATPAVDATPAKEAKVVATPVAAAATEVVSEIKPNSSEEE